MNFDLWRSLWHTNNLMLVIIGLNHAPFIQGDLLVHHLAQPVNDCTLNHIIGGAGIDDLATDVNCDPDLVNLDFLVCADGNAGNFGKISLMTEMETDAHRGTFWHCRLAPT